MRVFDNLVATRPGIGTSPVTCNRVNQATDNVIVTQVSICVCVGACVRVYVCTSM